MQESPKTWIIQTGQKRSPKNIQCLKAVVGEIQLWVKVEISTRKAIKNENISDEADLLGFEAFRVWLFLFKIEGLEDYMGCENRY